MFGPRGYISFGVRQGDVAGQGEGGMEKLYLRDFLEIVCKLLVTVLIAMVQV